MGHSGELKGGMRSIIIITHVSTKPHFNVHDSYLLRKIHFPFPYSNSEFISRPHITISIHSNKSIYDMSPIYAWLRSGSAIPTPWTPNQPYPFRDPIFRSIKETATKKWTTSSLQHFACIMPLIQPNSSPQTPYSPNSSSTSETQFPSPQAPKSVS